MYFIFVYAYEEKHIQTLSNIKKIIIMITSSKAIKITKGPITHVPAEHQKAEGCVAFQFIYITYTFYGAERTDRFDTKIMENGDQFINNGNGFFPDGTKVN